jgi:hypothetical protein
MLHVSKLSSLFDQPIDIIAHSLQPNQTVVLHLLLLENGINSAAQYQSWARFTASERGVIDVAIDPALDGTYRGIILSSPPSFN